MFQSYDLELQVWNENVLSCHEDILAVEQNLSVFLEAKRVMVFGNGSMCSCCPHHHQNSVNWLTGIYLLGYLPNALTLYMTGLPYN